LTAIKKSQKFI